MSTQTGTSLKLSRVIRAAPDRVFRAWTEADQLKQWSAPEGVTVAAAEVDLTVGGRYHIQMQHTDGTRFNVGGVYRAVERPHRLVYTWQWEEKEHDVGETLVTVEFNDLDGSTEVVLTHERMPNAEAKAGHEQGWAGCLNRLEEMFK